MTLFSPLQFSLNFFSLFCSNIRFIYLYNINVLNLKKMAGVFFYVFVFDLFSEGEVYEHLCVTLYHINTQECIHIEKSLCQAICTDIINTALITTTMLLLCLRPPQNQPQLFCWEATFRVIYIFLQRSNTRENL